MKKITIITIALSLLCTFTFAQKSCTTYMDGDGTEYVLTWEENTGASTLYFYKVSIKGYAKSSYQLPANPTGDSGKIDLKPYFDADGTEYILACNTQTGKTKLYFYKVSEKGFAESSYQLPSNPTGDAGTFEFCPYVDADGTEYVLVLNKKTGNSKLYFYKISEKGFALSSYQLPKI